MRKVFTFFLAIVIIAVVLALSFGIEFAGIHIKGFFDKERANVERDVFRNTDSYDKGMVQQLTRFRLEYMRSTDETEKAAIRSTVRTMFAEYPINRLSSPELRAFLQECRNR